MAVFAYRALTTSGRGTTGIIDAETGRHARDLLRARGLFPTTVEIDGRGTDPAPATSQVPTADLAATTRRLAILLTAGLAVADALDALLEDGAPPTLRDALTATRAAVGAGEPLARALAARPGVFPPLFRELVRAGEASGTLPGALERVATHLEARAAIRNRLRTALAYPAMMTVATTLVVGFLLAWVIPEVSRLFVESGRPLPVATRLLVAVATAVHATWWLWLLAIGIGTAILQRWRATDAGARRFDALLLRLPLLGPLLRDTAAGRMTRTLGVLVAGGVPLEEGLGYAATAAGNREIEAATQAARERIRQGHPLAIALRDTGVFSPLIARLVATGERGGSLAGALDHAATAVETEVARQVATATALVEPALVLLMGGVVLALVLAVLLPILTLTPGGGG